MVIRCFAAPLLTLVSIFLAFPASAQRQADSDAEWGRREAEAARDLIADNTAIRARVAYKDGRWSDAMADASASCSAGKAIGCEVLGKLLAEGRVGPADPRGAEGAHRKAAGLYAQGCRNAQSSADNCRAAAIFLSVEAVPGVRDEALARRYFTWARDGYARSCLSEDAWQCALAGTLTYGEFTGRPDPKAALALPRMACSSGLVG